MKPPYIALQREPRPSVLSPLPSAFASHCETTLSFSAGAI
jgi:hypothetical protein